MARVGDKYHSGQIVASLLHPKFGNPKEVCFLIETAKLPLNYSAGSNEDKQNSNKKKVFLLFYHLMHLQPSIPNFLCTPTTISPASPQSFLLFFSPLLSSVPFCPCCFLLESLRPGDGQCLDSVHMPK